MRKHTIAAIALLIFCVLLAGCAAAPATKLSAQEAEPIVKAHMVESYKDLNPDAAFPLFDFTPPEVFKQTGFQVFKVAEGNAVCQSFLIKDRKICHEIMGFGGFGVVSAAPARFESRGSALVYTYSWGSGLHRSILEVYDSEKGAFPLYTNISGEDMQIEKEADNRFGVYVADLADDVDLVNVKTTKGDRIGTLSSQTVKGGGYRLVFEKMDGGKETAIVNEVSNEVLSRVGKIANPKEEALLSSSSTADYIKADRADYDAIVAMGEKALPVMLEQIVVKQDKGLSGSIMQALIQDIVKEPNQMNAQQENIRLYKAYVGRLESQGVLYD